MALDNKKYGSVHGKTGNEKAALKAKYDNNKHAEILIYEPEAALMYQLEAITEELDYLRTQISSNKDKTTFPGIGTSGSTCLAGNTTTISTSQASAITANTKKTGITLSQANAITANTAKVSLVGGTGTALSFGEMITTPPAKGSKNPTYSIVMTAVKSGVTKTVTLTLI